MEWFKLSAETFGDPEKIPCLYIMAEEINKLDLKSRKKVLSYINSASNKAQIFKDLKNDYILKLVIRDFKMRWEWIVEKYNLPPRLHTRVSNFVNGKFLNEFHGK